MIPYTLLNTQKMAALETWRCMISRAQKIYITNKTEAQDTSYSKSIDRVRITMP